MKRDRKTVRKIPIAVAVSLSLSGVTGVSHALGLGEIEMYSALNETLDAEIEILSATESELQDLQVGLASSAAFARAGLEQPPVLSSVDFVVDRRPDGKAIVKVTSDSPVLEPFLNFLIEVDSPGSVKLVREYTVLLNPATFADSSSATSPDTTVTSLNNGRTIGSGTADGGGVGLDLSDATIAGGTATAAAETVTGSDSADEVFFTETSSDSASGDSLPAESDNLFVPDDDIFANTQSATTAVDSDGELISLEQELNITPQFDQGVVGGADSVGIVTGGGEPVEIDNLGTADETVAADSAIFTDEFDTDAAGDAGGDLITGEELRELTGTDVASSEAEVQFTETIVPIQSFESEQVVAEDTASEDTVSEEVINLADNASSVTDSDATGDLVDLSGVFDAPSPVASETQNSASSRIIETSGETYEIKGSDTLWSIANAQKESDTTPHQMMVALLDANPSAFVNGNMNRLRTGAVLQIPTKASQTSTEAGTALAIVRSWTRDNKPPVRSPSSDSSSSDSFVEPVTLPEAEIVVVDSEPVSDLASVNSRYEQVQDELAAETMQRDELQGRVDSLSDNMEEMKTLITVRENDLETLEDEVAAAESSAAEIDAQINEISNASNDVAELQQSLNRDLADAQAAINRQADLDRNLADAEAQAQSVRLSSEEDSLRAQLATLEIEKRELEASSQVEKAALVRESEAEKTRLLAQAKAERERIMSELEDEKARIGIEAEAEIARIKGEADVENQRVVSEAQAESERLKAETAEMQAKLEEVEAENIALEKADLARESEEELAQIRQEALDKVANSQAAATDASDSDAAGMADKAADTGKSMVAGGTAAVGGLLGFAPLQEMIGNRKNVLAAGAGLSLLGLLAAWGLRRRKHTKADGLRPRTQAPMRPRAETNNAPSRSGATYEQEKAMYGENTNVGAQVQQRTSNSGAAAAAAAAAAVTGTAGVAAARTQPKGPAGAPVAPEPTGPMAPTSVAPEEPAPVAADAASQLPQDEEELEGVALDDTITEAEVYLRYGLHGQAEDLLKTAIDRSPDNEEYHFKLLENYYDQKNTGDFKATAATFTEKFPASGHSARIAEMEADLGSNGDSSGAAMAGGAGAIAAGVAATGAVAAGALGSAKDAAAGGIDSVTGAIGSDSEDLLDQTIDPGSEFSVDELQATGNLGAMADDTTDFGDPGGMELDDVDIAALDDDGTMNLEEVAGSQMSGGDLGTMDFTNPDVDGTFDNLTLDDAELNSLGDVTGDVRSGAETDLPVDSPIAGDTDEMETMLDLAKAYIDMGDDTNASKALKDIAARGNPMQQTEANELLKKLT